MARTTTQLRDAVLTEGGFDSSLWSTSVVTWLDERHKELIAESKWRFADDYVITTTVANQAVYTVPDAVVQLEWVEVGGDRYYRASPEQAQALAAGEAYGGGDYWFTDAADADGDPKQIRLYPAPSATGTSITAGRASLLPSTLDTSSVNPIVPEDLEQHLIAGAIATGERRVNKRPDVAEPFEQVFQAGVDKLRRRRVSRVGRGAVSIPVAGFHFRR